MCWVQGNFCDGFLFACVAVQITFGASLKEGAVAKWLGAGLQIHEHRFESGPHLHFFNQFQGVKNGYTRRFFLFKVT